jgi:hypothetical protein
MPGKIHSLPSSRTTGCTYGKFDRETEDATLTTQISFAMNNTSALSGNRAILRVAALCCSFCCDTHGLCLFISAMRVNVSEWCTRDWLNDFASDA